MVACCVLLKGMWCIVSAPLILGLDVTDEAEMDSVWDIVSNTEAIAIDQAWHGHPVSTFSNTHTLHRCLVCDSPAFETCLCGQGKLVLEHGGMQVWSKPLGEHQVAVLFVHDGVLGAAPMEVTIPLSSLSTNYTRIVDGEEYGVRDVWAHRACGVVKGSGSLSSGEIPPHDSRLYRLARTPDKRLVD